MSRQAVSKWESDRGIPEIDKLLQISNMFGVTLDYLLKSEGPDENNKEKGLVWSSVQIFLGAFPDTCSCCARCIGGQWQLA